MLTVQLPDNPKLESIMIGKLGLTAMLVVALTPMPALGQVSTTDDPSPESAVEGQWTADESVVADALLRFNLSSTAIAACEAPRDVGRRQRGDVRRGQFDVTRLTRRRRHVFVAELELA